MLAGLRMKRGPGEERQLVCVLTGGRDTHCARPIVIQVGQLVRQPLQLVGGEAALIHDDVVAGGVDGPLSHRLGDEEEIVPEINDKYNNMAEN